jgi:L-2-hydroxyglutarate oxidase
MNADVVIIGGGIVGLATAWRLLEAQPRLRLVLVEKETRLAAHQTGNNSGVIHSGLYYRPGSLKATNCREGYAQLLEFCRTEAIPHEICGKVVVATMPEELPRLEELHRRGLANGLEGIRVLNPEQIREIEPHCAGIRGLWVPQTGIVDYTAVSNGTPRRSVNTVARSCSASGLRRSKCARTRWKWSPPERPACPASW